jgi:hypothetical protein
LKNWDFKDESRGPFLHGSGKNDPQKKKKGKKLAIEVLDVFF